MNTALLIPRRRKHRPGWFAQLVKLAKRIADYRYYRSLKQGRKESWDKAGKTL